LLAVGNLEGVAAEYRLEASRQGVLAGAFLADQH
jgi:hypothetical protein